MNPNRRNETRPEILKWFGNMSVLSNFLNCKPWLSPWGIVKMLNSYLRGLGHAIFANNIFTGILIFCGMIYGNPHVAFASVLCGIISVLTCKLLKAPDLEICEGISLFNSLLVAFIVTSLLPRILGVSLGIQYWFILGFAAFITNYVEQGLATMMAPSRLLVLSIPFNLVATCVFLIYRAHLQGFELETNTTDANVMESYNETVDWGLVFQGTICSIGQVYGVPNIPSAIMIWLGFFIYSPLLTFFLYIGSVVGAVFAVFSNVRPLAEIYIGHWSFNSLLSTAAIILFIVPTPLGMIASIVNAVIAVSVQIALTPVLLQTRLPIYSHPFTVASVLVLAISLRKGSALRFVEKRTFPEEHFLKHYELLGNVDFDDKEDSGEELEDFDDKEDSGKVIEA